MRSIRMLLALAMLGGAGISLSACDRTSGVSNVPASPPWPAQRTPGGKD